MTDEAEATAPEQSSAPEETVKPVAADTEQTDQDTAKAASEVADEEEVDSADPETDDKPEKPKKPTRTSQLRATIRDKSLQIEALQRQLSEREADQSRQPPKEADFNGDYEAYNRALIAHETAELLRNERSKDDKRSIEERQDEIRRERLVDHNERVSEVRKVIPDYDKVVSTGLSNIDGNPKNLELLLESEKSELIAYHLAEKPERAREFARMHPLEAAKHIGKLEARLSLPKPKTTTGAPPPVAPLKGGAAPQADLSKMSMDDYVAFRRKQEAGAS